MVQRIREETSERLGNPFFHSCCSHGTGPRRVNELLLQFGDFLMQLAVNILLTKIPHELFLAAYDCCLVHPTP